MFTAPMIFALIFLSVALSLETDTKSYVQDLIDVDEARKLLDLHVKKLSKFRPDPHYLAVLGLVRKTAESLLQTRYASLNSTQLLLHYLYKNLSKVRSKPRKVVNKVQKLRDLTVLKLQPLTFYIKYVCKELEENECNKMIDLQTENDSELKNSIRYLNLASDAARGLLTLDPDLGVIANAEDVVPYVLGNLNQVAEFAEAVARLMGEADLYLHDIDKY